MITKIIIVSNMVLALIIGLILVAPFLLTHFSGQGNGLEPETIIGGDDGPTAIYVSSSFNTWGIIFGALVIILLSLNTYLLINNKNRQQEPSPALRDR